MKLNYLFPNKYKKFGWMLLIPSAIFGCMNLFLEYEPDFFDWKVPAIYVGKIFGESHFFGLVENNVFDEILGVFIIISSLIVAFSREKLEDEYISKIRLESLVWAVYFNYAVLIISFIFLFDMIFFWVMIFNMFTIILFFITRFHWQIYSLKKASENEE